MNLYSYVKRYTQKATGILDIGKTYQSLISMTTPTLEAGEYFIGFAFEADFNGQKNRPMIYQITGDFTGAEYSASIGDNDNDTHTEFYAFPKTHTGGPITLGVQAKKAASFNAQLDVDYIDVFVRRVG